MSTPLQVTILTALVQQLGRAPKERWNLFSRYFAYTYDREIERNTFASALLADHRTHIERIHARTGLLLQVEAERAGGASSRMSREQLEFVIDSVLQEDEVASSDRIELVKDIALAAENRLVFLVEPEPGKFGFEIRSLQEFMAAWALSSGRDSEIEARMKQVADAPMFRNVLLFMASKFFGEGSPLRDVYSEQICGNTKENDIAWDLTRAGSLLSLETLEEGAALSQPKRGRMLMSVAVDLLQLPPGPEHRRLGRVADKATSEVLSDRILNLKSERVEGIIDQSSAWVALVSASDKNDDWAQKCGNLLWPPRDGYPSLFEALALSESPLSGWLSDKVTQSSDQIDPALFCGKIKASSDTNPSSSWAAWLMDFYGRKEYWPYSSRFSIFSISPLRTNQVSVTEPSSIEPESAKWQAWITAARYENNPSVETLCTALEFLAPIFSLGSWDQLQEMSSWPLKACLVTAESGDDLINFANQLRSGELGDEKAWKSAEDAWASGHISFNGFIEGIDPTTPWSASTVDQLPPFSLIPAWIYLDIDSWRSSRIARKPLLNKIILAFDECRNKKIKSTLATICLVLWKLTRSKNEHVESRLLEWIELSPWAASLLIPRPQTLDHSRWIELLNKCQVDSSTWIDNIDSGITSFVEAASHPLVVRKVSERIIGHLGHKIEDIIGIDRVDKLSRAIHQNISAEPDVEVNQLILLVALGKASDVHIDRIVIIISTLTTMRDYYVRYLLLALDGYTGSTSKVLKTLNWIIQHYKDNRDIVILAISRLRALLQKRASDLNEHANWNRLGLPLPQPSSSATDNIKNAFPLNSIAVSSVSLKNICGIQNLTLNFEVPDIDKGQWILLLGPNGVGKTTLLRSFALALRSIRFPGIWPRGAFSNQWKHISLLAKQETQESSILVSLSDGTEHKTTIRAGGSIGFSQSPEQIEPRLFPLFAYGCRRGSALGGASRQVNLEDDDGPEIATLFDDGADLIQAETWLVSLEGDSLKNDRSRLIFRHVTESLKKLLNVQEIEIIDQKLWVSDYSGPRLPFGSLSDGYLSSAGWFLDIIARWLNLADRSDHVISEDFISQIRGLVLIDEIDLHLHPRWQVEIVERTREILPRMSFIATTHNPLTLVGADANEIWMLTKQDSHVKGSQGLDTPALLSGGQLYRRYFGIEDIYPKKVGQKLKRYAFLSGYAQRNSSEEQELDDLKKELSESGVDPGWEVVPRSV
ncbi:AAA family ATPase [Dokdonella sp. MW10]|uniref:AAA family ATPase n=1 Tax=Dokdonella sp. MW10 TaxID=2992926 RepID=UPI003F802B84